MGGNEPAPTALQHPDRLPPPLPYLSPIPALLAPHPCPTFRHSCAPLRHSCAGRNAHAHTRAPAPTQRKFIPPPFQRPLKKSGSCRDDERRPIWSARGRLPPERTFSKVSGRGEVRWGVGGNEPAPTALQHPDHLPPPLLYLPPPPCPTFRHSCAGRNAHAHTRAPSTYPKKIHPSPLPGGRLGGGWDVSSQREPPSNTPIASPAVRSIGA